MGRNVVQAARLRARRAAKLSGGSVIVGLSGKDAITTLDICKQEFERVEAFFMYLVPGLECVERPVKAIAAQLSVKLHLVPHWELSKFVKYAVFRDPVPNANKLRCLKLVDVEKHLRAVSGINWFGYGERASDSYARQLYTRRYKGEDIDGVHEAWRRVWPIYDWSTRDVLSYLRGRRLPLPPRVGADTGSVNGTTGINLFPDSLLWLKRNYPDDYAKVLAFFPHAEVQVRRLEMGYVEPLSRKASLRRQSRKGKGQAKDEGGEAGRGVEGAGAADEAPEIHGEAGSPLAAEERAVQPEKH